MAQACNLMKLSRSPLAKPQVGDSQHSGLVCVVNNNSSITIGFMMVSRCSKHVNYNYSFLEFTNQLYLKKKQLRGSTLWFQPIPSPVKKWEYNFSVMETTSTYDTTEKIHVDTWSVRNWILTSRVLDQLDFSPIPVIPSDSPGKLSQ